MDYSEYAENLAKLTRKAMRDNDAEDIIGVLETMKLNVYMKGVQNTLRKKTHESDTENDANPNI
jgi:hypothetical protein